MKTKIIATIGPASNTEYSITELAKAGVRIFRLNFSHGNASDFMDIINIIRKVETKLNVPITIMQDLSGPKLRLGILPEGNIDVHKGMILILGQSIDRIADSVYLPFDHKVILDSLVVNDTLVLADGSLQFIVRSVLSDKHYELEAQNSGVVTSRKGLALPGKATKVSALTKKDKADLAAGLIMGVDAVALSYVQTADDVIEARNIILVSGKNIPIVVKMERQGAVDNLDSILAEADIIMVARGDLGVECPLPKLPGIQKMIIEACNKASKPVIVATQMLLSMLNSPAPTRAETTDVANAVLDGADCVMLSEETAMGNFPIETVKYMRRITTEAEKLLLSKKELHIPDKSKGLQEYLAYSACLLANQAKAKAIVSHSMSGSSARLIASRRPSQTIYALTPELESVKTLNFCWGVVPIYVNSEQSKLGHLERIEKFIEEHKDFMTDERVVITAGQPRKGAQSRGTNLINIFWK